MTAWPTCWYVQKRAVFDMKAALELTTKKTNVWLFFLYSLTAPD